ncbi:TPA: LPXTG cell wall anchor domain-containing protein, partial [Streptococcus agalactiae]
DDEGNVTEVPVPSNEVVTHTPEPEVPATPETPVEDVPVVQSSILPLTGDDTSSTSILASVVGILMILVGLVGVRKRKED